MKSNMDHPEQKQSLCFVESTFVSVAIDYYFDFAYIPETTRMNHMACCIDLSDLALNIPALLRNCRSEPFNAALH